MSEDDRALDENYIAYVQFERRKDGHSFVVGRVHSGVLNTLEDLRIVGKKEERVNTNLDVPHQGFVAQK